MFPLRYGLVLVAALAFVACGDMSFNPFEGDWSSPGATITWEGTVTSSVDGAPIQGAAVIGYRDLPDGKSKRLYPDMFGRTDTEGHYTITINFCPAWEGTFLQAQEQGYELDRVYIDIPCETSVRRTDFVLEPK
jgi:hypothetical protein